MNLSTRSTVRTLGVAARALLVLTVVVVAYTALVTGIARLVAPAQAAGSPVTGPDGRVVGSALLGQSFLDADGAPLPQYLQPRPSAAGDGYDAGASSGSNLGPESPDLVAAVRERRATVAAFEGVDPADVPPDAVTASGSGLDPHISPEYASIQVARLARERSLTQQQVEEVVARHTEGRGLGLLGEPTVDVLGVNLDLDRLEG